MSINHCSVYCGKEHVFEYSAQSKDVDYADLARRIMHHVPRLPRLRRTHMYVGKRFSYTSQVLPLPTTVSPYTLSQGTGGGGGGDDAGGGADARAGGGGDGGAKEVTAVKQFRLLCLCITDAEVSSERSFRMLDEMQAAYRAMALLSATVLRNRQVVEDKLRELVRTHNALLGEERRAKEKAQLEAKERRRAQRQQRHERHAEQRQRKKQAAAATVAASGGGGGGGAGGGGGSVDGGDAASLGSSRRRSRDGSVTSSAIDTSPTRSERSASSASASSNRQHEQLSTVDDTGAATALYGSPSNLYDSAGSTKSESAGGGGRAGSVGTPSSSVHSTGGGDAVNNNEGLYTSASSSRTNKLLSLQGTDEFDESLYDSPAVPRRAVGGLYSSPPTSKEGGVAKTTTTATATTATGSRNAAAAAQKDNLYGSPPSTAKHTRNATVSDDSARVDGAGAASEKTPLLAPRSGNAINDADADFDDFIQHECVPMPVVGVIVGVFLVFALLLLGIWYFDLATEWFD